MENEKTQKRVRKTHLAVVLLTIIAGMAVFVAISVVYINKKGIKVKTAEDNPLINTEMFSDDEYREKLAAQESDIDGWTKLDKYNAGLDPADGSDTDGDGLTDKEEIEVYGSDPLKRSTSGDLYTDAYKIENGMDIHTSYDYSEDVVFAGNECDEVILTATAAEDMDAVVKKYGFNDIDGYTVYANYNIYNYGGQVAFNVSGIVKENDIKVSDLVVLRCTWTGSDMEKMKTTTNGTTISVNESAAYRDDLVYIIAKKNGIGFGSVSDTTLESSNVTADGGVFSPCVFLGYFGIVPTILYVPSGNEELDNENMDALIYEAEYNTMNVTVTYDDVQIVTQEELDAKLALYAKIPWAKKVAPSSNPWSIGQYCDLEMITGINRHGVAEENFALNDELPFRNFGSYISPSGNCAGFAHLTSLIYNTGSAPSSGEYKGISWDLTVDSDNNTLTDTGLYDYKYRAFTDDHTDWNTGILNVGLSEGEEEFVKMIGAYWSEANDVINANISSYRRTWGKSNYSWNLVEGMMDFLDRGKILDASFLIDGNSGHTINIVGYGYDESTGIYEFYVYDNNYPGDKWESISINATLYIKRKSSMIGHSDTFGYSYMPYDGCGYFFSSQNPNCDDYLMVIYDENFTILNDIYDN